VWADGIYLGAGLEKQNSCLLTLLGARPDGTKELLAMEIGYRESKDSWADVLRSLRDRGLSEPLAFIADGNLGIWAALTDDFPTPHWFHIRTTNPIESVFASVRLRTNVAKRARNRENALYLVFKIVQRLSRGWRSLNGDPILTQALLAGVVFKDGLIQAQSQQSRTKEVVAA